MNLIKISLFILWSATSSYGSVQEFEAVISIQDYLGAYQNFDSARVHCEGNALYAEIRQAKMSGKAPVYYFAYGTLSGGALYESFEEGASIRAVFNKSEPAEFIYDAVGPYLLRFFGTGLEVSGPNGQDVLTCRTIVIRK